MKAEEMFKELKKLKQKIKRLENDYAMQGLVLDNANDWNEHYMKENAELKARLENCIEPKFKKGDWVYVIEPSVIDKHCGLSIFKVCLNSVTSDITYDYAFNGEEVTDDEGYTSFEADIGIANECYIYKTKEQAEAKLKELQ